MNEEQAVLDFFAKEENLPLGLAVAEQTDTLREQMNNRFWRELQQRLTASFGSCGLAWKVDFTGDKNATECLVGLHCTARPEQDIELRPMPVQEVSLRPMMEQQYLGGVWRIYFGLMWSAASSPDHLGLDAVCRLKDTLQQAGFKSNASFLAWQWTRFHPRRSDFLLRFAREPEKLLGEIEEILKTLLTEHRASIEQANTALKSAPHNLAASLNQLRNEMID